MLSIHKLKFQRSKINFVHSHRITKKNINQFLFTPWHEVAKLIWFPLDIMARKMLLHSFEEIVLLEEDFGNLRTPLWEGIMAFYSGTFLVSLPGFHESILILFLARVTIEAYGSARLTSYLKISSLNEEGKIKRREREREYQNSLKRIQSPSSS